MHRGQMITLDRRDGKYVSQKEKPPSRGTSHSSEGEREPIQMIFIRLFSTILYSQTIRIDVANTPPLIFFIEALVT